MLAHLFRSNRPAILVGLVVLVPLLVPGYLVRPVAPAGQVMPLYGAFRSLLGDAPWAIGIATLLLVAFLAIQVTGLSNASDLMDRRNHLPALLFPLLFAAFDRSAVLDPALTGMPFVLWSLRRTWSLTNRSDARAQLFDSGLLMGIAALFYLPYLFLVVVLWASVSVIRPFDWREYVLPLLGSAVAIYLAWGVMRLLGETPWRPMLTISDLGRETLTRLWPRGQRWLLHALLWPVVAVALYRYADSYQRGIMRVKNIRSGFLGFCVAIGVIMAAVWLLNQAFPPVLLAIPLSVVVSYAFMSDRRAWLSESAVVCLLVLALWVQWG